ncbi:MAG: flippase [Patescibacteria group bacterium]
MESSKITQNTTYLTIASIFQKALSFIYFAFLAKILGTDALGQYQAVLSFTGIFIVFMDFGLGPVLTREAAKEEENLPNLFSKILGLKIVLIISTIVGLVTVANLLHYFKPENYTNEDLFLIYIGTFVILLDTLIFTFFCVFRALKNLQYEAINVLIYQGIIFCVGLYGLIYTQSVFFLLVVLFLGSSFSFVYFLILIKKKTNIIIKGAYNYIDFKKIFIIAAPFAVAGIFVRLNGTVDMLMLKYILKDGNHYAGLYALAFKLTLALTVLSGAFASSYFPSISYYIKRDISKVKTIFENGISYMMLLSLPIMAGVLVLADKIILTVWSESFTESITPLRIYIVALLFIFLNYPVGNFLNAANKQVLNTINTGIALIINITLNYFLIRYYNIVGACISALSSSTVLVCLGLPWVYKMIKFDYRYLIKRFLSIFTASLIMGVSVYGLRIYLEKYNILSSSLQLILLIITGILVYGTFLFITRGLTKSEFKSFIQAVKNK